jgi:hypothetical protein
MSPSMTKGARRAPFAREAAVGRCYPVYFGWPEGIVVDVVVVVTPPVVVVVTPGIVVVVVPGAWVVVVPGAWVVVVPGAWVVVVGASVVVVTAWWQEHDSAGCFATMSVCEP